MLRPMWKRVGRKSRKRAVRCDKRRYKRRSRIEIMFGRLKDWRRLATRYDTRRCHTAIIDRTATAIIPIRKNGRPWKEDCPAAIARNETLRAARHYGSLSCAGFLNRDA